MQQVFGSPLIDNVALREAVARYLQENPVSSVGGQVSILHRDAHWSALNPTHQGAAFWCYGEQDGHLGDTRTGALEIGWFTVPLGATTIYLPLTGGGATDIGLMRVKFVSSDETVLADLALGEVMKRLGNSINTADFVYRFPLSLADINLSSGDVFKIRLEDNDSRGVGYGTCGIVPQAVIMGM
ncbi:MAG: hypothetical protein ACPGVO_20835 [Spirulinaceae cyanobacterium]